jgi:hypothetical protein
MKELLFEIEKAFHLASYYLEEHSEDTNQDQFEIDFRHFKEAQEAFYKLLDIVNKENSK